MIITLKVLITAFVAQYIHYNHFPAATFEKRCEIQAQWAYVGEVCRVDPIVS